MVFRVAVKLLFAVCLWQDSQAREQIDRKLLDKAHPTVDFSDPTVPKLKVNGRVLDLAHGEHFDDILIDTPDDIRPPAIIAFHGYKTCPQGLKDSHFQVMAENVLPARERLFIASYDVDAAPKRAWYKFTPERDLAKRFNVDLKQSCPQLVFVPRSCNGWTEWCRKGNKLGCEDFKEQCTNTVKYDDSLDDEEAWIEWVLTKVKEEGDPKLSNGFQTYERQGKWIRARDSVSTTNIGRNNHLANKLPGFTPNGAKSVPCPDELCDWLEEFYTARQNQNRKEHWAASGTQNSFHVTKTKIFSIDAEYDKKMKLANKFMKPMMEEWSGIPDLQLTSFYGIREYNEGHWLRKHVDREETHVISATISVAKFPVGTGLQNKTGPDSEDPWPLEGVNWQGENVIYPHAPRTIVLYESAKFIHGRYKTNPVGGGIHLGAFLHYAPPDGWGWEKLAKQATDAHVRSEEDVPYVSTPSVELQNPVYSDHDYLAYTQDDIEDVIGTSVAQIAKSITFQNPLSKPLYLFWSGDSQLVDQCGQLAPGKGCTIQTFNTHTFIWSDDKKGKSLVGSITILDGHPDGSRLPMKAVHLAHEEL